MQLRLSHTYIFFLFLIINVESILYREPFRIFVKNVASIFHSNWRRHFLSQHPNVRNRFKLTHNGSHYNASDFIYPMILTVGSCLVHRNLKIARDRYNSSITYVDILNMNYDELPDDWAHENRATARVACRLVLRSVRQKRLFNRNFIEKLSEKIHIAWITRNKDRTTEDLTLSYIQLPEIEKAKDRRAVLIACRLYNELHLYRQFKTDPIHLIDPLME